MDGCLTKHDLMFLLFFLIIMVLLSCDLLVICSTLRYANRAKNIQNKPKINEDPKDAMLREYQEEIRMLKMMLESQGISMPSSLAPPPPGAAPHLEQLKTWEEEKETIKRSGFNSYCHGLGIIVITLKLFRGTSQCVCVCVSACE